MQAEELESILWERSKVPDWEFNISFEQFGDCTMKEVIWLRHRHNVSGFMVVNASYKTSLHGGVENTSSHARAGTGSKRRP